MAYTQPYPLQYLTPPLAQVSGSYAATTGALHTLFSGDVLDLPSLKQKDPARHSAVQHYIATTFTVAHKASLDPLALADSLHALQAGSRPPFTDNKPRFSKYYLRTPIHTLKAVSDTDLLLQVHFDGDETRDCGYLVVVAVVNCDMHWEMIDGTAGIAKMGKGECTVEMPLEAAGDKP